MTNTPAPTGATTGLHLSLDVPATAADLALPEPEPTDALRAQAGRAGRNSCWRSIRPTTMRAPPPAPPSTRWS